jgi:acetyltransferase
MSQEVVGVECVALELRNGRAVRVRPVRPADAEAIQEFVRALSDASRRLRFFAPIRELAPATLARLTESTSRRDRVLLAEAHDGEKWCMVALAQYAPGEDAGTRDLALVVADAWQGQGLGRALMGMLIQSAHDACCARVVADVLRDNEAMLALGLAYDFTATRSPHDSTMLRLVRDLRSLLPTVPAPEMAWISAGNAPQGRQIAGLAAS